jgi:hypothetical protein
MARREGALESRTKGRKNMSSKVTSKSTAKDRDSKAMLGIDKHLAGAASVTLNGTAYTPAELKSILKKDIDSANIVDAARAAWQKTVKDEREIRSETSVLLHALKGYLVATHGEGAVDLLADFGFTPPKPRKVTVKVKATAADKTALTRALRHTMGKKQKAKVKATVPASAPAATASTAPALQAPAPVKPAQS